jgi:hypothetical protein
VNRGEAAEQLVYQRLRAALPDDYAILANVHWLLRERGQMREGEADVVVAHPDHGILAIEVKSGPVSRDGHGRWFAGGMPLRLSPFDQASRSQHALVAKLRELPDWEAGLDPTAGHAVAFPDVDLASLGSGTRTLGPDADPDLVLDRPRLLDSAADDAHEWVDRAFRIWASDGAKRPPGERGVGLLVGLLENPVELRTLLRSEIQEGEREVVQATELQLHLLKTLQRVRRADIRGGAGTGKTMLAVEKARRLAHEGFRTLLVCFNSPLARLLADETRDVAATGYLDVLTFHQLAEDLGREAGTLGPKPSPTTGEWFSHDLPDALDEAIEVVGPRYHAIVVDEGQDFDANWLVSLEALLFEPQEDVLYVFHDPAQDIYRDDAVAGLGLSSFVLDLNCRNAAPIHELVARFADAQLAAEAMRTDGRPVEHIPADSPEEVVEAVRVLLHRLVTTERLTPPDIAVLTGIALEDSAVWRHRRFGNQVLWNGAVDDTGRTLGLAASAVPEPPSDVVLCESIRRFKGLERPVVVIVELRPDDPKHDQLLYIGASRARHHLIIVGVEGRNAG